MDKDAIEDFALGEGGGHVCNRVIRRIFPYPRDIVMSKPDISVETKGWRILVLSEIRTDAGCQPRSGIVDEVVEDYHAHLSHGGDLPPVAVFYDGSEYYLADGYHRFHAHDRAGLKRINAIISQGTLREAVLYSLGANQTHGLRRSNEDKRRAVERMFGDDEWRNWSDAKIADHVGVSQTFVRDLRPKIAPTSHKLSSDEPERRLGRDGRMRSSSRKPKAPGITRTSEYSQSEPDYQEKFRQINEDTESAGAPLPRVAASAPPQDDSKGGDSVVTHTEPCDCGGTIHFDDALGIARCDRCGSSEAYNYNPERAAVADPEPKRPEEPYGTDDGPGSSSETNARPTDDGGTVGVRSAGESADRPGSLHGGTGGSPATDRAIAAIRKTVVGRHMSDDNLVLLAAAVMKALPEPSPHEGLVPYWVDPDDPVSVFANGLAMAMKANRVLNPETFVRCWPQDLPMLSDELNKFCDWLLDFEAAFRAQYKHGNDAALRAAE
jgi:hypothetical protein